MELKMIIFSYVEKDLPRPDSRIYDRSIEDRDKVRDMLWLSYYKYNINNNNDGLDYLFQKGTNEYHRG